MSRKRVQTVRYGDTNYDAMLLDWANESDFLPSGESSDSEIEEFLPRDPEPSSSSDDDDDDGPQNTVFPATNCCAKNFIAPSGLDWQLEPPQISRTPVHNIIRQLPGLPKKQRAATPGEAFRLFMSVDILEEIVYCTNMEGKRVCDNKRKQWKNLDLDELCAYLGLVLQAGVERSWDVPVRELFGGEFPNPLYRATMSVFRFEEIRRFLRFDDKRTREIRLETDKLAMISHIWQLFIGNCKKRLIPEDNVTIDEQLLGYRGRTKFIQYMPSKPSKYGIKIFWMCESASGYAIDGLIYVGRQPGEDRHKNLGLDIVKKLVLSIHNSGINLTIDNFFTSVPLAIYLLDKNITTLGTLRQNKRDIPVELKASRSREVNSSLFCFRNYLTMVSYVPKRNKSVILLSSMHHDKATQDDGKRKPTIILEYNKTKGGVDLMDQKVGTYTCKRQTKRWPMVLFYNIVDIAALNAFIVFKKEHPDYQKGVPHARRLFLKELARELVISHMKKRSENPNIQRSVLDCMKSFISLPGSSNESIPEGEKKRKRCHFCPSNIDRKSKVVCGQCKNSICSEHSVKICNTCFVKQ